MPIQPRHLRQSRPRCLDSLNPPLPDPSADENPRIPPAPNLLARVAASAEYAPSDQRPTAPPPDPPPAAKLPPTSPQLGPTWSQLSDPASRDQVAKLQIPASSDHTTGQVAPAQSPPKPASEAESPNPKSKIENPKSPDRPFFVFADRVAREIEWLHPGLIPLGKVTLLVGDPGIGKSLLAVDLAMRVTRGIEIPPARKKRGRGPGRVLYLAGDGETEDILPLRLEAFGADLKRVGGIDAASGRQWSMDNGQLQKGEAPSRTIDHRQLTIDDSESRFFSLRYDLDQIDESLAAWPGCRLVVIDPVSAFLDGLDANSNMGVRRMLMRLAAIARRHNTAVLVISHFRKAGAAMLLYRSLGSIAFTLATSVVLTLAADRTEARRRLLLPAKMNPLPEQDQHGRAFSIGLNALAWDPDPVLIAPDELCDLRTLGMNVSERVEEVARWLSQELLPGRKRATEIALAARKEHIPMKVLYAARRLAQVRIVRDGCWYWEQKPMFVLQDWQLR